MKVAISSLMSNHPSFWSLFIAEKSPLYGIRPRIAGYIDGLRKEERNWK